MNAINLSQTLIFGIFVGALYGVAAIGLSLVFGVMRVLYVAHGELMVLAGFITYFLVVSTGLDPYLSLFISVPALYGFGLLLDRTIYARIHHLTGENKIKNSLLVSFGLSMVLQTLLTYFFSADERTVQTRYAGDSLNIGGIILPYNRIISFVITLLVIGGLHGFLQRSTPGKAIRAAAEDAEAADLAGIDIKKYHRFTMALSSALAGLAGTLIVVGYGITPSSGAGWVLRALIVVVLAGTGNVPGTFTAGVFLGLVEAISGALFGATSREIVGLVMFLVVLVVRPQGLMGKK